MAARTWRSACRRAQDVGGQPLASEQEQRIEVATAALEHIGAVALEHEKRAAYLVTATAFFLAATAALLRLDQVREFRYQFGPHFVPLGAGFLVASLILGTVAVLHAVMAFGPQIRHSQHVGLERPSPFSFLSIAEEPPDKWAAIFRLPGPELQDYRLRMYVRETREVAKEAQYKYGRLGEARAFLFLAVASLAIALVFVFHALLNTASSSSRWSADIAVPTAAMVAAITWTAARDRHRVEEDHGVPTGAGTISHVLSRMAAFLTLWAFLVVLSSTGSQVPLVAASVAPVPAILALSRRRRDASRTNWRVEDRLKPVWFLPLLVLPGVLVLLDQSATSPRCPTSPSPVRGFTSRRHLDRRRGC